MTQKQKQKRIQVRVPITGKAILSDKQGIRIKAIAKDISRGGLGLNNPSKSLEHIEYQIDITTEEDRQIQLKATLVHKTSDFNGFKTSIINEKNLEIIADLIAEYQTTDDFIKQIDKHDLFEQNFIDEDGSEISVTFDTNQDS